VRTDGADVCCSRTIECPVEKHSFRERWLRRARSVQWFRNRVLTTDQVASEIIRRLSLPVFRRVSQGSFKHDFHERSSTGPGEGIRCGRYATWMSCAHAWRRPSGHRSGASDKRRRTPTNSVDSNAARCRETDFRRDENAFVDCVETRMIVIRYVGRLSRNNEWPMARLTFTPLEAPDQRDIRNAIVARRLASQYARVHDKYLFQCYGNTSCYSVFVFSSFVRWKLLDQGTWWSTIICVTLQ